MELSPLVWLAIGLGLALLAAGLGLWRLRTGAAQLEERRSALLARAQGLSRAFSSLARQQPPDPGEPYTQQMKQLADRIRQGWEKSRQVETRLRQAPPQPGAESARRLVLLAPLFTELAGRLRAWLETAWLERRAAQAESILGKASQFSENIHGLGKQEQAAVERLRQEVKALQEELAGHRLAPALAAEREKLARISAELELAAARLAEHEPTRMEVVQTYPARTQAEQELASIRQAMHGHETSHERLQPRLARQRERLEAFEAALQAEEGRRLTPRLRERTTAARQELARVEANLARGEYSAIEADLVQWSANLKELEESLKVLISLRDRLRAAQEQAGAALSGLRQWMRQYPAPFVLDTAQEQAQALQSKLQEQARAAASEDPAELEAASQVALDEVHKARSGFERSLEIYQRLAPLLTAEAIEGLQKRGENLAARLKLRHPNYQVKARLASLEEQLARLVEGWRQIQGADPRRQSDLARLGPAMQQVESAWGQLERGLQRAFDTLEAAKAAQERTLVRLEDDGFGEIAALAQMEGIEWAASARNLVEQRQELVKSAGHGNADFSSLLTETEALLKESTRLAREYQFRLARAQTETTRLVEALNGYADRLTVLERHPYLDCEERTIGTLNGVQRWLGQAQTQAQGGLERWAGLAESGAQLRLEADGLCRGLETEVSAADQDRAWTADMLATAEEFLGSARQQQPPNTFNGELTSARNLLDTARRKLSALATPRRKYLLGEYQAELADVRQMITAARGHVDRVLG